MSLVSIPSAFLLHGYVGFIFGSVKANPWWSTPLMPIVFLFSAMVSGIAIVLLLYMLATWLRGQLIDMRCVDTIGRYLLYAFIIDFSLEMLDLIHRIYDLATRPTRWASRRGKARSRPSPSSCAFPCALGPDEALAPMAGSAHGIRLRLS